MKSIKKVVILVGLLTICGFCINAVQMEPENEGSNSEDKSLSVQNSRIENHKQDFLNDYRIHALPIPQDLDFAGEPVPVENPDIRERLDRELLVNTYWQSNALLLIKRANKYFPVIEPILEEYGVPEDLKYVAVIESGLTNAVSPAGARGFW